MSGPDRPTEDMRRLAEASAWRVSLAEADQETNGEFEAWLAADNRNHAAWRQIETPWAYFGENSAAPELIAARRAALGDARRLGQRRWGTRNLSPRIAAIAALLCIGVVVWAAFVWHGATQDYRTAFGERRTLVLSDGSRISLDSQSEVRVAYSRNARELELLRGQARFEVAHDVERPFSVRAGSQKVVATGTDFNVDIPSSQQVLVTLIEGHVVVLGGKKPVELHAGEQLSALNGRVARVERVAADRITSWESGQLFFDNEDLSSVVQRVSRYATTPVTVMDGKAAHLKISGVFNAGDAVGFVETVTHYLPLKASAAQNGQIQLRSKS